MGVVRFLLALSVVLAHINIVDMQLASAAAAVQGFFIISGFYIALVLDKAYATSPATFYANRFLRIFPVYWILLILGGLAAFAVPVQLPNQFEMLPASAKALLVFSNIGILGQDWLMFLSVDHGKLAFISDFRSASPELWTFLLIPPAWSLGVELTFYILAPWLLRSKTGILIVVIVISAGIRLLLMQFGLVHDPWSYRFFPAELAFFLVGSCAYRCYARYRGFVAEHRSYGLIGALLLVLIIVGYSRLPVPAMLKYGFLLSGVALALPFAFFRFKDSKIDKWLGDMSYPLYISHWIVIHALSKWFGVPQSLEAGAAYTVGAILFAVLLLLFVDFPLQRIRARVRRNVEVENVPTTGRKGARSDVICGLKSLRRAARR